MSPEPYTIHVEDEVLDDLRTRLERTRWPEESPGEAWTFGIPVELVQQGVAHWIDM